MESIYKDLIQRLEPFKNTVFYYALTEAEVSDIERKTGKKFPNYFRQFLKTFGVKQDFVFGLFRKENDFIESTRYLPEEVKKSFVLIGDNTGEDFWLLNAENPNDTNIYEWQHWSNGKVVKLGYDFKTLIEKSIANLSDIEFEGETNDKKSWCVQFAIPTNDEQKLYARVPLVPTGKWELKEISPAEVHCFETTANIADKSVKLQRQEYSDWDTPIYYFDLKEPVNELASRSLIKDIDTKLKEAFPKYKLIDYGILPSTD